MKVFIVFFLSLTLDCRKKSSQRMSVQGLAKFNGIMNNFNLSFGEQIKPISKNLAQVRRQNKKHKKSKERNLMQVDDQKQTLFDVLGKDQQFKDNFKSDLSEAQKLNFNDFQFEQNDPYVHDKISQYINQSMDKGQLDKKLDLSLLNTSQFHDLSLRNQEHVIVQEENYFPEYNQYYNSGKSSIGINQMEQPQLFYQQPYEFKQLISERSRKKKNQKKSKNKKIDKEYKLNLDSLNSLFQKNYDDLASKFTDDLEKSLKQEEENYHLQQVVQENEAKQKYLQQLLQERQQERNLKLVTPRKALQRVKQMPNLLNQPWKLDSFVEKQINKKNRKLTQANKTKRRVVKRKRYRKVRVLYDKNHNVIKKIPLSQYYYKDSGKKIQQRNLIQKQIGIQDQEIREKYESLQNSEQDDRKFLDRAKKFLSNIRVI